ncbi:MAG: bactofilin family protein [Rhodoferax sp.]
MFSKTKQAPIKSLIAAGSQIRGDIVFTDGLRVDGEVIGNIQAQDGSPSMLVISESASVVGSISADLVVVNGSVRGPVHASGMLELQPRARIEGDVDYHAIEVHKGAQISGLLRPALLADEVKPTLKLAANNP